MIKIFKSWFKKESAKAVVDKKPEKVLPHYIEKVGIKYRVKGLKSVHADLNNAIIQYRGWKNAN